MPVSLMHATIELDATNDKWMAFQSMPKYVRQLLQGELAAGNPN